MPVIFSSFVINFPKWFELELKDMIFNKDQNDLLEVQNNNIKEVNSSDIEIITIVAGMLIIRMVLR